MAEATIAPDILVVEVSGNSRARSAYLWTRALLHKARMGIVHGVSKVQVTLTRAFNSTAAAGAAAGAQIALATRAGWDAGAKVLTKGLGVVAKGALLVAKGVSWVVDKIGKAFGWFVGLFNRGAGERIKQVNQDFTNWRIAKIEGVQAKIEVAKVVGYAAMTTQGVSTVGRIAAGGMGLATVANIATHGAVAAHAATLPIIGPMSGLAFGPMGLLVTGGIALLGGLFAWFFKRDAVNARLVEIEKAAYEKRIVAEAEAAARGEARAVADAKVITTESGLTIKFIEKEDGNHQFAFHGNAETLQTLRDNPEALQELIEADYTSRTEKLGGTVPLALEDITDEMVLESFKSNPVKPGRNNGTDYSQAQIDKRRGQIHQGTIKVTASV